MEATPVTLQDFGAALAALSALATAAFGLLDASKAFWGGVSNVGLGHIRTALTPFEPAFRAAVGPVWWDMVRANWLNGVAKAEQKASVARVLKLGLSEASAPTLAIGAQVDGAALAAVAKKLRAGAELTDRDLDVLGRMNAALEAVLDHAFEKAEQQYRNVARLLAGVVAVALSLAGWALWEQLAPGPRPSLMAALLVGLLAVPIAPVAKDLTSGLSAALHALKASRTA
jgi:hypothetical protein